ncbi:MAG: N-6 DNA methylase [Bacteroidia bacterium]|nr:N-6 DNA methylase [Bacteroidia bacterium]
MREVNYHNELEYLEFSIYRFLDVFRNTKHLNSVEDLLSIGLLFLSLHKDGLLNQADLKDKESFDRWIQKFKVNSDLSRIYITYEKILSILDDRISILESNVLHEISLKLFGLNAIDKEILKQNFPLVFDKILYEYLEAHKRSFGEFIQPIEVTRFMLALADLKEDSKIFNPFAGLASLGIYSESNNGYFAQEINRKIWALGSLRLLAFGRQNCQNYVLEDSVMNWPNDSEKFDFIVSSPPFRMKIEKQSENSLPVIKTVEQHIILRGLQSLNENGKLAALLPMSFLYSHVKQEHDIRKFLVDKDLIDTIISIPGGILPNTGIPFIVLLINKRKIRPGFIRFIKADTFVEPKGSKGKILNDSKLCSLILQNDKEYFFDRDPFIMNEPTGEYNSSNKNPKNKDVERIIELNQIKESNYNINVPRFFQRQIDVFENENLVKLGDLLKLIEVKKDSLPTKGKSIRIRDLKNDRIDFILDASTIDEAEIKKYGTYQVAESCLLLAMRWKTLKPTYFDFNGEVIYRNQDVLSCQVNVSLVDIAYLVNELHSDYVIEQLNSFRSSSDVMPVIRKEDLMQVLIKLPSIKEQKAKIAGIIEIYKDIKLFETFAKNEKQLELNEVAEQNNFLRHSIAGNLANLRGSFKKFKNIFEGQIKVYHPELLDLKESAKSSLTLAKLIHSMERDIDKISSDTQRNSQGDSSIQDALMESIEIIPFITEWVNEILNNPNRLFEISLTAGKDDFLDSEGNEVRVFIKGNKNLLKDMFNNIIENAIEHAFESDFRENNLISVDCYGNVMDEPRFLISISNNGKRLPEDFTQDMFVRKGSKAGPKAGNGFGGWLINQIIQKHKGTLEIDDEQGPHGIGGIWSTSFEIDLPILNYEKYE